MKNLLSILGTVVFFGSGLLMWIVYVGSLANWFGFIGFVVGVITTPGAVIFPLIYWFVEGVFPVGYFLLWGVGLAGMFVAGMAMD